MSSNASKEDIAVIGMSCRTAGANSPSELWNLLANARDVQTEITRFNSKGYYHPEGAPRKGLTNVKRAYMLDDGVIDKFDNAFFFTTPHEAAAMDPQQRMLLEIAYEAVENAGIPLHDFIGTDTAVFAGMEGCDYHTVLARDINATPRYLATGTPTCMAANRLSYFFDLSGPSMSVDTACSSAMAALHQAVRTLQHGDSKMALVCGAKLILNPDMFMPSSELGFLSPSGKCQSFDAAGDGYGRGEGTLAILLKPLQDAVTDGDPVRSVIKGTRLNQDGRTQGITLPSADAQKDNMESLYQELGIHPSDIHFLEAHGTGTAAGDPIEFNAINSVFRPASTEREALVVGSVKSNIGHLEACSALASIVKTTECLERGIISPQMHFHEPNPKIDLANVLIPTTTIPWPKIDGNVRRAAINTFGAGGTNGHAVLESYPRVLSEPAERTERALLFKVSAADERSLKALCGRYADYVENTRPSIYDLAHTLLCRRSTLRKSICFTAKTLDEVISKLRSPSQVIQTKDSEGDKEVLFLFTGQGAQWATMGKILLDSSHVFRKVLVDCDASLASLPDSPSWSIVDELGKSKEETNIHKAEYSQPLCTALQVGLVVLLDSWGLKPHAVVGHSSGEIAAAYAAGLISAKDAIVNAYYRGLVLSQASSEPKDTPVRGAMCAIGLGEQESIKLLDSYAGRIKLAAINSPTSCTLSGDQDAIQELVDICSERGQFCRKLQVDRAYHSHHMLLVAGRYEEALERARHHSQFDGKKCDMWSSVTGLRMARDDFTAEYWGRNMTSTVRFSSAIERYFAECAKVRIAVEIGPHPALKGPATENFRTQGKGNIKYFGTCSRGGNDFEAILESVGSMISQGLRLKFQNINACEDVNGSSVTYHYGKVLTDLPGYQWNHGTSFWAESRDDGTTNLPPAAYILMALEAARQIYEPNKADGSILLTNLRFSRQLPLHLLAGPDKSVEIQLVACQEDLGGIFRFQIFSQSESYDPVEHHWGLHCSGSFEQSPQPPRDSRCSIRDNLQQIPLHDGNIAINGHGNPILNEIKTCSQGMVGGLSQSPYPFENYSIDPRVLHRILSLPPALIGGRNLPATYCMHSIQSFSIQSFAEPSDTGRFAMIIDETFPYGLQTSVEVQQKENMIHSSSIVHEAEQLQLKKPPLESLFFRSVSMCDVASFYGDSMELCECVSLLSHKWPMSDIKIMDMKADSTVSAILAAFQANIENKRQLMRSVSLDKSYSTPASNRVQQVDPSQTEARYHMIYAGEDSKLHTVADQLLPQGLACFPVSQPGSDQRDIGLDFDFVCEMRGLERKSWGLWRKKRPNPTIESTGKTILFGTLPSDATDQMPSISESIKLEPVAIAEFCILSPQARFHAIVVDSPERSIIAAWEGSDLLPWLKILLKFADSILWVTKDNTSSPFQKLAGTLLRTLQAEQPSLKVCWIIHTEQRRQISSGNMLGKDLLMAQSSMLEGDNEVKMLFNVGNTPSILRYHPDDELSSALGTSEPRTITSLLDHVDYRLSFATPQQPVILSEIPNLSQSLDEDEVEIDVEASVIDPGDVQTNEGCISHSTLQTQPRFFAGTVRRDGQGRLAPGTKVLGWSSSCHQNRLRVSHSMLLRREENEPATDAASKFAAVAAATCIVDEVTRARHGDSFDITLCGVLEIALHQLCESVGAVQISSKTDKQADFVVTCSVREGLQVNGRSIDIATYLRSERGRAKILDMWPSRRLLDCSLQSFNIAKYPQAFTEHSKAGQEPYSTTIDHALDGTQIDHVPIYSPRSILFSPTANYILVGGLGGLGRFICTWMVAHGARRLNVLSRSGLTTPEARSTHAEITRTGASLSVFRVDACDRTTVHSTLSTIRSTGPIKGVINLAMILGDAPMASMTGDEWDRALRVKVDSSWILHQETLDDELDHFILFSSIASVCGNRNQGNYNVANTFLNALAEYRQESGRTGVSVALGAMTDMGVLYDLSKPNMLDTLTRSGLSHLTQKELAKIMEAAVLISPRHAHPLLLTGLQIFPRTASNHLLGPTAPLFWTELPEFSHLQTYAPPSTTPTRTQPLPLKAQIRALEHAGGGGRGAEGGEGVRKLLTDAFLAYLARANGFETEGLDPREGLGRYGVDSLSAVGCQYWFWRELGVDIPVGTILGGGSVEELVGVVCEKMRLGGSE